MTTTTSSLTDVLLEFKIGSNPGGGNVKGLETYSLGDTGVDQTSAVSINTLNNYLSAGNVVDSINTSSQNLTTAGTGSGPYTGDVTITLTDNPTFTSTTNTSDERLKTNISPLSNSLENVNKLQGVSYNWIDPNKPQDKQIGLIAQEVEKVYPEFVHTGTDEDKTKSVNYSQMVSVLIESIKDLTNEVSSLKSRITELENK
jgi:hypothetical protein